MSPVAFAGAPENATTPSTKAASAERRKTKQMKFIGRSRGGQRRFAAEALSSGDLRIEMDGFGFPLLIKRPILGRNRKRIAVLHCQHDALRLRFESRV